MQKNGHGLLCSLVQQLLSHDASHIDHVLSHYDFATSMDTVADWDVRQLREILSAVLKRDDQSTCIFLDGLDEVADKDEPDNLFSVVDSLISYNKVKLCVASRPEPVFHRHLSRYPSLKLQDHARGNAQLRRRHTLQISEQSAIPVIVLAEHGGFTRFQGRRRLPVAPSRDTKLEERLAKRRPGRRASIARPAHAVRARGPVRRHVGEAK